VKTRLCPPLGLELAARFAGAFLADVLEAARSVDPDAGFLTPRTDVDELRRFFPDAPVIAQRGVGLPAALEGAVSDRAILVSGDAPTYPPRLIQQGVESEAGLVLGPSLDGGYCLIGMRRFHPAPFRNIAWSTGAVLKQTADAARSAGLSVEILDAHRDVDTIEDLLAIDLAHAPATAALLTDPDVVAVAPRRPPVVVGRDIRFSSPWRRFVIDELGRGREYSYLDVPPAVWVVPVSDAGETVLVRQYRHPVGVHPLETPAGSINPNEDPAAAAVRELREEVGGVARELHRVGGFYSSSAHISLRGLVFLATGVEFGTPTHAHREGIELVKMPLDRAVDLAQHGELCEAQSALALIYAGRARCQLKRDTVDGRQVRSFARRVGRPD
jgi:glycosyltransferase A (GT-A) superfamily protein (DUF2064 family)/8-oxo-dGTP pyrophosphatase MutT (NUDIX family)